MSQQQTYASHAGQEDKRKSLQGVREAIVYYSADLYAALLITVAET